MWDIKYRSIFTKSGLIIESIFKAGIAGSKVINGDLVTLVSIPLYCFIKKAIVLNSAFSVTSVTILVF